MKHATSCRFCKRPITVEIDDEYAKLGDPYKLIPFATCNRCADLRVTRRYCEEHIRSQCNSVAMLKSAGEKIPPSLRKNLEFLTQRYAKTIADWHGKDGMCWEDSIVDDLIEHPHQWADIIKQMWKVYRNLHQVEP